MNIEKFKNYCNHYEFTHPELKEYLDLQTKLLKIHIYTARADGDNRDKNIIYAEWISTHSQWFRYIWIALKKGINYE